MTESQYSPFWGYLEARHGVLNVRERAFLTVFNDLSNNHDQFMVAYGAPLSDLARRIAWMMQPIYAQRLDPTRNKQDWVKDAFWLTEQLNEYIHHSLSQAPKAIGPLREMFSRHIKKQYKLLKSLPLVDGIESLFQRHQQHCYTACDTVPGMPVLVYTKGLADRDEQMHSRLMATMPNRKLSWTLLSALVPDQCSFDDVNRLIDYTSHKYDLLRFLAKGDSEFGFTPAQHQDLLIRILEKPDTDSSLQATQVTHYLYRVVDDAFLERVLALHASGQLADGCLSPTFYNMTEHLDPVLVARIITSPVSASGYKSNEELAHWVHAMVMDDFDTSRRQALVEVLAQQPEAHSIQLRILSGFRRQLHADKGSWYRGSLVHWLTRPSERHQLNLPTADGRTLADCLPEWLDQIENAFALPVTQLKRRYEQQLERLLLDQVPSTPSNDQVDLDEIGLGLL